MNQESVMQNWEELLIGLLMNNAGLCLHVRGILSADDFEGEETKALYQLFEPVSFKPGQPIMKGIPSELLPTLSRSIDLAIAKVPDDGSSQVKMAVETAVKIKRASLVKKSEALAIRIQDTTDEDELKQLNQQRRVILQQIQVVDKATHLQG